MARRTIRDDIFARGAGTKWRTGYLVYSEQFFSLLQSQSCRRFYRACYLILIVRHALLQSPTLPQQEGPTCVQGECNRTSSKSPDTMAVARGARRNPFALRVTGRMYVPAVLVPTKLGGTTSTLSMAQVAESNLQGYSLTSSPTSRQGEKSGS
ncbi:hypothetical protein PMIN06_013021 [Paraphaeosphaeria minitans]